MTPLDHLAKRCEGDPFFAAHRLAAWAQHYHLTDAELAASLGCTTETLTRLRLCGAPTTESDVVQVARELGVSEDRLGEIFLGETDLLFSSIQWPGVTPPVDPPY